MSGFPRGMIIETCRGQRRFEEQMKRDRIVEASRIAIGQLTDALAEVIGWATECLRCPEEGPFSNFRDRVLRLAMVCVRFLSKDEREELSKLLENLS